MNHPIAITLLAVCLVACDAKINTAPADKGPDKVVEKNTTVINPPPAKVEEKKTTVEIKK